MTANVVDVQSSAPATPLPHLGARLRRLRRIRGLKQSVVAEFAGVAQTTASRWERGEIDPEPELARRLLTMLAGSTCNLDDGPLRRLIETSPLSVHLVTDADHRLLAASPSREREWCRSSTSLLGQSLWRYATEGIQAAEARLHSQGWWQDPNPSVVKVQTGAGRAGLTINAGLMLWELLYLTDGTPVRLCSTIAYA
jgi:transcriptional regulator with XRE-family HTH domain